MKYGMLLGKDSTILDVCPAYVTDALLRKVNVDRYDDREIVKTNLIESYDILMEFARKHLLDKFFLEDVNRVSLRNILAREMISNTLMHREFTSGYIAKFVIEKDWMYVENANRASGNGFITPDNMQPSPKNPIIASFFRTIGLADNLGSGTRKLFKYSRYYSGSDPELIEGDVFRINVPLNDDFSFDYSLGQSADPKTSIKTSTKTGIKTSTIVDTKKKITAKEEIIIKILRKNPLLTLDELAEHLEISKSGVRYLMDQLKKKGLITRIGSKRNGDWCVNEDEINKCRKN